MGGVDGDSEAWERTPGYTAGNQNPTTGLDQGLMGIGLSFCLFPDSGPRLDLGSRLPPSTAPWPCFASNGKSRSSESQTR